MLKTEWKFVLELLSVHHRNSRNKSSLKKPLHFQTIFLIIFFIKKCLSLVRGVFFINTGFLVDCDFADSVFLLLF